MCGMAFPQLPTISANGNRNRHKRAVCSKSLLHIVITLNPNSDPLGSCCQSWTELICLDQPAMFHVAENNILTKAFRSRLRNRNLQALTESWVVNHAGMRTRSPGAKDSCPQTACPVAGHLKGTAGRFLSSDASGNTEFSLVSFSRAFGGLVFLVGHGSRCDSIAKTAILLKLAENLMLINEFIVESVACGHLYFVSHKVNQH